mgnify:CR=1 FL=1
MCAMFNNSLANSLFGSRNSIWSGSFFSASNLGDLGLMKSGVYTKMLKSYYEKVGNDKETTKSSSSSSDNSPTWDDIRKRYVTPEVKVDAKDTEAEKLFRIREAEETKNSLMQVASEHIAPLQDAVDLEIATEEETSLLEAWKKYRVLLNRVNTTTAPDIEWPVAPIG